MRRILRLAVIALVVNACAAGPSAGPSGGAVSTPTAAEVLGACRAHAASQGPSLDLASFRLAVSLETRPGAWDAILVGPDTSGLAAYLEIFDCTYRVGPSGVSVQAVAGNSNFPATDAPRLAVDGISRSADGGYAFGRASDPVVLVRVRLPDGRTVDVSVSDGFWIASWGGPDPIEPPVTVLGLGAGGETVAQVTP